MPAKFSQRSYEAELMDAPNIPKGLMFQNLSELDLVNRTLGGHTTTLSGMKELMKDKNKTYHVVDIGCGGGDAMKHIAKWGKKNSIELRFTGVDMNADCISYMKEFCKYIPEIDGVTMDYRDYLKQDQHAEIIHCSLFCHHLKDEELIELFSYLDRYSKIGFVINDLHRHWFAYYSIKFLTRLLNGSVLVKNDAPLSVLRGFKKRELELLLEKAGVKNYTVKWKWAFRYLIVGKIGN